MPFSRAYAESAGRNPRAGTTKPPSPWIGSTTRQATPSAPAYSLIYNFVVGFCIEEQAVQQATREGDERYSLERRAARVGDGQTPLVLQSGPEVFGDPDTRFTELVEILIDAVARMRVRTSGSEQTDAQQPSQRDKWDRIGEQTPTDGGRAVCDG
ncbi:MAG: TetR/AcrR family transcriptional regulator C-terminal domain-containing protein [Streptosporangiaceae bacterium]